MDHRKPAEGMFPHHGSLITLSLSLIHLFIYFKISVGCLLSVLGREQIREGPESHGVHVLVPLMPCLSSCCRIEIAAVCRTSCRDGRVLTSELSVQEPLVTRSS